MYCEEIVILVAKSLRTDRGAKGPGTLASPNPHQGSSHLGAKRSHCIGVGSPYPWKIDKIGNTRVLLHNETFLNV